MSRPVVLTRIATQDDLATMLALLHELRQVGGRAERAVTPVTSPDANDRMLGILCDPQCRVTVALVNDVPAGLAVMQIVTPDPLSDGQVVDVTHVIVARANRHHGIGHHLMAAAADFATERHIDHVAVSVYPSLRDAIRFFARLGFAPMAVRRIAPLPVLRRRLGAESGTPAVTDAVRRRARIIRPVPPQRIRRRASERVES